MKKLFIGLLILTVSMSVMAAPEPTNTSRLSIRVRMDRYFVKLSQIKAGLYDLWNGTTQKPKKWKDKTVAENETWCDNGWLYTTNLPPWTEIDMKNEGYFQTLEWLTSNSIPHEDIWMFYNVSDRQTGGRATDTRVKYWKGVAGNTNTFKIFRDGIELDPKTME